MTEQQELISSRRDELVASIKGWREAIADAEAELAELAVAERVIQRLSGTAHVRIQASANLTVGKRALQLEDDDSLRGILDSRTLTMPMMIERVAEDAYRQGLKGMTPKDIAQRVRNKFGVEAKGDFVSSIVWRMWKRGQLTKVGEGLYSIAPKNETSDQLPLGDGSEASDDNPAQGREAGPGGGT